MHQDERGEGAAWGRFCSSFSWQTSIDRLIVIMRFACRLSMKSYCCGRRPSRTWEGDRGDTTCGPKHRTVRRIYMLECSTVAHPHATVNANTAACTQGIGGCPAVLCRHHSPLLWAPRRSRVNLSYSCRSILTGQACPPACTCTTPCSTQSNKVKGGRPSKRNQMTTWSSSAAPIRVLNFWRLTRDECLVCLGSTRFHFPARVL